MGSLPPFRDCGSNRGSAAWVNTVSLPCPYDAAVGFALEANDRIDAVQARVADATPARNPGMANWWTVSGSAAAARDQATETTYCAGERSCIACESPCGCAPPRDKKLLSSCLATCGTMGRVLTTSANSGSPDLQAA
jgi:hypothetical protein